MLDFIINPFAGSRDNLKFCRKLFLQLDKNGVRYESTVTRAPGHGTELAKEKHADTERLLVSVGGDGTFNEIASALVGTSREMAHIPRGSGNGLARMLKIPIKIDKIPDYLEMGVGRPIDVGTINDDYFFCTCGFGFDALIAHDFSTSTKRGLKTYVRSVLKRFWNYRGVEARLVLDGEEIAGRFFTVTFANANQYGNDAFIAPYADLQDGLIDVTLIRPFPLVFAPLVTMALMGKWIHKLPFVETRQVKSAGIYSVSLPFFHSDGDVYDAQLPVRIGVKERALNILVPAEQ